MRTVLVIDDNPGVTAALKYLLGMHEIRVISAATPEAGLDALRSSEVDLVIADMNFRADTTSGVEGAELFRDIRKLCPDLPVILLTAWTHLEAAVQLVKAGAADYVAKPWDNDKLLATVENLLELSESTRERIRFERARRNRRERLAERYQLDGLVFQSAAMEAVVDLACRIAGSPVAVLISGPNGAGKEIIAKVIHQNSAVGTGPFVAVNCGALPPELIEAELFGAQAGAYTGARETRAGRFELANSGTLFLDEIGNLPIAGQVKLLRVLETGQYEQLGSSRTRNSRVRIISASNADLPAMIRSGQFREDLFYRLNVVEVAIPPLADRQDDVIPLAEHFLGTTTRLSDDARAVLRQHNWPGNVRELRNVMERAKLLSCDNVVHASDLNLPVQRRNGADAGAASREPDAFTPDLIERTLREANGNITRAAQVLGISRQALYRRLEWFGIRLSSGSNAE